MARLVLVTRWVRVHAVPGLLFNAAGLGTEAWATSDRGVDIGVNRRQSIDCINQFTSLMKYPCHQVIHTR